MPYSKIEFQLWADIDGTQVDLVNTSLAYEMNRIPHGVAALPVGRKLPGLDPSTAHDAARNRQIQVPIKVHLHADPVSSDAEAITPSGDYLLFEGFVTGLGYRRGVNRYQLAVQMTHWLSGLNFASSLSESSHPHNPAHFSFNSAIPEGGAAAAGGNLKHFHNRTRAQGKITQAAITEDLWGQGIKPWFEELTSIDRLNVMELGAAGNDSVRGEANAALNRFSDRVKLPLDLAGADAQAAARAIAADIAVTSGDPANNNHMLAMANVTLWDKLVGDLGPTYMFSVIPLPESALVVPFIPGLREHWEPGGAGANDFTVLARDLDFVDMNSKLPRALRALGIFGGRGFISGANLKPNDYWNKPHIGGMYEGRDDGMVMFKNAPRWLSEAVAPFLYSKKTTGADGEAIADGVHPEEGGAAEEPDPKTIKEKTETLMNNMAQALYANEILKGRYGQISGAVRFDIAPGSNIAIEGVSERFLAGTSPIGEHRFATVLRTDLYFDAESHPSRAGTGFALAHIRSEQENENDDTSVEKHPLYTETFPGSALIGES